MSACDAELVNYTLSAFQARGFMFDALKTKNFFLLMDFEKTQNVIMTFTALCYLLGKVFPSIHLPYSRTSLSSFH